MAASLKSILVATDGSAGAARAEAVAVAIAAGCKCTLVIVTISRNLPADEIRRLAHTEGDIGKARHVLIEQILERAEERARAAGVAEVLPLTDHGDPAATIIAIAQREQVDMIVIGRRGLGGLSQLLLGSVSKTIVDRAPCAVTVVP